MSRRKIPDPQQFKHPGLFLKAVRQLRGLSAREVCDLLGEKSRNGAGHYIYTIENGRCKPQLRHIMKLSKIYQMPDITLRRLYFNAELERLKSKWGIRKV